MSGARVVKRTPGSPRRRSTSRPFQPGKNRGPTPHPPQGTRGRPLSQEGSLCLSAGRERGRARGPVRASVAAHCRVPLRSAVDQRSAAIAFISVALIVGVVRLEIVGVPAPYVVKVRDGVSRVLSDFRPIHHRVDHPDEIPRPPRASRACVPHLPTASASVRSHQPEEGMAASFVSDFLEQGKCSRPLPVKSRVPASLSKVYAFEFICSDSFVNSMSIMLSMPISAGTTFPQAPPLQTSENSRPSPRVFRSCGTERALRAIRRRRRSALAYAVLPAPVWCVCRRRR